MIRLSIRTKLAALLGSLSLLLVAVILLLVQASFDRGFHHYLNEARNARLERVAELLAEQLRDPDQRQPLHRNRHAWNQTIRSVFDQQRLESEMKEIDDDELLPPLNPDSKSGKRSRSPYSSSRISPQLWLLDHHGQVLAGPPKLPDELIKVPLQADANNSDFLAWRPIKARDSEAEALFATQQHRLFILIAAGALALCLLLAWPLSTFLVRPIQRLSSAMQTLMQRRYDVSVPVKSRDELGDLAKDFNLMARTLAEHDRSQRHWLADISHELRTPLGVLQGELEAIEDGVIELNPQAVGSLQDEVRQLTGLVDDLHQLAVTDLGALRYQFEPVDLAELLQSLALRLTHQLQNARLHLTLDAPDTDAS